MRWQRDLDGQGLHGCADPVRESVSLSYNPTDKVHSNLGYTVSAVNGSRFFNDARDVNGSMVSTYQSPFVNLA